jgi:hypothetical protein
MPIASLRGGVHQTRIKALKLVGPMRWQVGKIEGSLRSPRARATARHRSLAARQQARSGAGSVNAGQSCGEGMAQDSSSLPDGSCSWARRVRSADDLRTSLWANMEVFAHGKGMTKRGRGNPGHDKPAGPPNRSRKRGVPMHEPGASCGACSRVVAQPVPEAANCSTSSSANPGLRPRDEEAHEADGNACARR